jgi:7,8-dihydropterin-6-yl-methyl-4-(beta-D-ribofuranosyl)aminobenzene 5'-phosphate synthase
MREDPNLALLITELGGLDTINDMLARFNEGKKKAEEEWKQQQSSIKKIKDLGTTKSLEILPLIDWYTSRQDLKSEGGVSYLIKTDNSTVLFDLGLNEEEIDPSPLLHNMKQLRITLDDFDTIVISHNHGDHVGGISWSNQKTFSLTTQQIDLGNKKVYTPIPMTYPGLNPLYSKNPTIISKGVATVGVISNQLFTFGWTQEQALAVNVEGKGIVLVAGCGHQTLAKIIERAEALFDGPIYGIIGGLHYPVDDSRVVWKGIKLTYFGTGKVPWRPITLEEVQKNIDYLKKRKPNVVGLSPHDSGDVAIEAFRDAFPEAFKSIEVGRKIVVD